MSSRLVLNRLSLVKQQLASKRNRVRLRRYARNSSEQLTVLTDWLRLRQRAQGLASNTLLRRYVPILGWLPDYHQDQFSGDLTAGLVVAIMLVPQSMAYALLAGLPPEVGLYASILPLIFYAIFGTSRSLAVGPVAIVSLMVASALGPLAEPGSEQYIAYAIILSFLSGLFLLALGVLQLGFLANFISHPVIAGFTSAAALVIGFSQFKHLLGIDIERTYFIPAILQTALDNVASINVPTLLIAVFAVSMLYFRDQLTAAARRRGLSNSVAQHFPKAMPLVVVAIATLFVWLLSLVGTTGIRVVGNIPGGLPPTQLPEFDWSIWKELALTAVLISLVGFLESVSVAKSLASKRRQKISPNQEFIGLGASNVAAAFSGGYPVTGGFSRSSVNFAAGANTQLASIITACCITLTLLLFTPLLFHLPKSVLAAIIIVAVGNLVDFRTLIHVWNYSRVDGLGYLATFLGVLTFGPEAGIAIGIGCSLALHLWRTSRPHLAVVGRVGHTEHFRNVLRHKVETFEDLLLVRIDESLYFANAAFLEDRVLALVAEQPKVKHFILICSAVNAVDASALETLEHLIERLRDSGVTLHIAEVKGPVMDRLEETYFLDKMEPGMVFLSTHAAVARLHAIARTSPNVTEGS